MNGNETEIVTTIITGITYLTPLVVVIWKMATVNACVKDNSEDIKELQEKCSKWQVESERLIVTEQRVKSLESDVVSEKCRADGMEKSLSEIKGDLRDVSTKLDMLLKYNIGKMEKKAG